MTVTDLKGRKPRLLVAIASFGEKNLEFLRKIIRNYREMSLDVNVVVFSNAPKNLGDDIRVVVGLPSKDPWSLPFAHKALFAENVDRYDLFAYSEDDMDVTEQNIQAFLQVTPLLSADEVAGFLRYEADHSGTRYVPEAHGSAHWKPETVQRRGHYTVAEFSNEHAGFYLLTQAQLRRSIASGNFLRSPYKGRYGLPETAATDPYTCCGLSKVVCISAVENFLIHHLPNRYIGQLGTPFSRIKEQIQTLMDIGNGMHPASTLCVTESKMMLGRWSKSYDEQPVPELLPMVPEGGRTILSVGCGSGTVETRLIQRGMAVTALPLNSVIGAAAARLGIEIVYGNWKEGMRQLAGRKFDCVLVINLLHLQPDSGRFLEACAACVGESGTLLLAGPNFNRIPNRLKRTFGTNGHRSLRNFDESGINVYGPGIWVAQMKTLGFGLVTIQWFNHECSPGRLSRVKVPLGSWTARNWILQARQQHVSSNHRSS